MIIFIAGVRVAPVIAAVEQQSVDVLLAEVDQQLKSAPEQTVAPLAKLQQIEPTFSRKQKDIFYSLQARSLGLRGQFNEQISFIQSKIDHVADPDSRALFLYYLSGGYANLGDYEHALIAMNDGIILLPQLTDLKSKVGTLLSAVALFISLGAYDEAMLYAERIYNLDASDPFNVGRCMGIAEKVEINFLQKNSAFARDLLPEAIRTCDGNGRKIISTMMKGSAAIDSIDNGDWKAGLANGLPVLLDLSKSSANSHYVIKLEEAISRAYLNLKNFDSAARYGMQAWQRAKAENMIQLMEKTSENMAKIKRAQGQLNQAQEYYDVNLALKDKMLDQRLLKSLAFQRVKFDSQDKANQLALAEQKNKNLMVEQALQQGKNKTLLLYISLSLIVLMIVGAWLVKTWLQKNLFRTSSQIDNLTQVSNRAHFIAGAKPIFKNAESRITLVLFDMDLFKKINDTYGHAAGDWVLKTVCEVIKMQLRKSEIFGRFGGEEFAICLPTFTEKEVSALAERCRAAIAAIDTKPTGFSFVITASFGIATRDHGELCSFEETLAAADKALYCSKNEGRDRVTVYQ